MSPHVVLGLSPRGDVRRRPSATVQTFPDRDASTRTPSYSASGGISQDFGRNSARLSDDDGSEMYVELAKGNKHARRAVFSLIIGYATGYQHYYSATAGPGPVQGAGIPTTRSTNVN
jgi:hypothetical protein